MSAASAREVLIFTSTPNEFRSVRERVGREAFDRISCSVIDCGPGRIHASFSAARELVPRLAEDRRPVAVVGTGTAGSLSMALKQGDVIASNAAVISDWRMENGDEVTVGPYGWFDYRAPGPEQVRKMTIECQDDLVTGFMGKLPWGEGGFLRGNLLTSEAFVSGKDHKLRLGSLFGCLACDMESGVYGYVGNRLANVPWFNLRVVADTLDDTLSDYFVKERDMTEILGRKVVEALKVFDSSLA